MHYLLSNAEHGLPMEALQKQIDKVRSWRLKDFMSKTVRDCSLFSVEDSASVFRAVRREEEPAMLPVLAQADALLGKGHLYKTGGAASVGRVEISGRTLVIKRYNIKNFSHWLKRFWRPSRAWHSWREGNRLMFLGIATPKPLAVQEKRFLGLRSKAWLVTEFIEDRTSSSASLPMWQPVMHQRPNCWRCWTRCSHSLSRRVSVMVISRGITCSGTPIAGR